MADVNVNIKSIDNTNAGFASANRNLKKFANSAKQVTSGLLGTITGAGLGSAIGSALGLNVATIFDQFKRSITGITKEVEEAMLEIQSLNDDTLEREEARLLARMTNQERLVDTLKKEQEAQKKLNDITPTTKSVPSLVFNQGAISTFERVLDLTLDQQLAQAKLKNAIETLAGMREVLGRKEQDRIEALKTKLQEVTDKYSEQEAKLSGVTLKGTEQLEALRQSWSALSIQVAQVGEPDTVEGLLKAIELTKELTDVSTKRHAAELQAREGQRQAAQILGQGFEKAIVNGEKFSDVLKQIGKDLMQLLIRRSITNPLVDAIGGFNFKSLLGIFGGGKAIGGPVSSGSAYMVGENGPEMFMPTQSGNIVSNSGMSGMGGSTYYIDARGADRSGLARLEQMISQTQASIRPIALESVVNASARGII